MKFTSLCGALATTLLLSMGSAQATAIYLQSGDGTGDGVTGSFAEFGLDWRALSTYTDLDGNGVDAGDAVVDTVERNYVKDGVTVNDYWGGMELLPEVFDNEGYGEGSNWGLYFDYTLNGTVLSASGSSILAYYYGGTINVYYDDREGRSATSAGRDTSTDQLVMTVDVTGSGGDIANFLLFGEVSYVVDDMFFFADGTDFNTLVGSGVEIGARVDTNLDTDEVPSGAGRVLTRTSTLNGSAAFEVPEPGILALLGLGFAGLGFARRSKKAA